MRLLTYAGTPVIEAEATSVVEAAGLAVPDPPAAGAVNDLGRALASAVSAAADATGPEDTTVRPGARGRDVRVDWLNLAADASALIRSALGLHPGQVDVRPMNEETRTQTGLAVAAWAWPLRWITYVEMDPALLSGRVDPVAGQALVGALLLALGGEGPLRHVLRAEAARMFAGGGAAETQAFGFASHEASRTSGHGQRMIPAEVATAAYAFTESVLRVVDRAMTGPAPDGGNATGGQQPGAAAPARPATEISH